jgi:hypothetical protein
LLGEGGLWLRKIKKFFLIKSTSLFIKSNKYFKQV